MPRYQYAIIVYQHSRATFRYLLCHVLWMMAYAGPPLFRLYLQIQYRRVLATPCQPRKGLPICRHAHPLWKYCLLNCCKPLLQILLIMSTIWSRGCISRVFKNSFIDLSDNNLFAIKFPYGDKVILPCLATTLYHDGGIFFQGNAAACTNPLQTFGDAVYTKIRGKVPMPIDDALRDQLCDRG